MTISLGFAILIAMIATLPLGLVDQALDRVYSRFVEAEDNASPSPFKLYFVGVWLLATMIVAGAILLTFSDYALIGGLAGIVGGLKVLFHLTQDSLKDWWNGVKRPYQRESLPSFCGWQQVRFTLIALSFVLSFAATILAPPAIGAWWEVQATMEMTKESWEADGLIHAYVFPDKVVRIYRNGNTVWEIYTPKNGTVYEIPEQPGVNNLLSELEKNTPVKRRSNLLTVSWENGSAESETITGSLSTSSTEPETRIALASVTQVK